MREFEDWVIKVEQPRQGEHEEKKQERAHNHSKIGKVNEHYAIMFWIRRGKLKNTRQGQWQWSLMFTREKHYDKNEMAQWNRNAFDFSDETLQQSQKEIAQFYKCSKRQKHAPKKFRNVKMWNSKMFTPKLESQVFDFRNLDFFRRTCFPLKNLNPEIAMKKFDIWRPDKISRQWSNACDLKTSKSCRQMPGSPCLNSKVCDCPFEFHDRSICHLCLVMLIVKGMLRHVSRL